MWIDKDGKFRHRPGTKYKIRIQRHYTSVTPHNAREEKKATRATEAGVLGVWDGTDVHLILATL